MTLILTLYLWPFHLRKHLKDPIGLINHLSKFCKQNVDSSNSTSGNSSSKVFMLIALASAPVSACRTSFLSKERSQATTKFNHYCLIIRCTRKNIHLLWLVLFRSPFSLKKSAWIAGSLTADATFILPVELGFCGLEEDFWGKLPDFLQAIW